MVGAINFVGLHVCLIMYSCLCLAVHLRGVRSIRGFMQNTNATPIGFKNAQVTSTC
jgi:hypothetical protein